MHLRTSILLLVVILFLTATSLAQNNGETPSAPELQLTATQLIIEATASAQSGPDAIPPTDTPDPFILTATGLVRDATAQAGGTTVPGSGQNLASETPDSFEVRATELIQTATAQANNPVPTPVNLNSQTDGVNQPLNFALIAVGLLVFVLIAVGGGYVMMTSANNDEKKK